MSHHHHSTNSAVSSSLSFTPPQVYHITTLPLANEARVLLDRVVREFLPIIQRRHYNVTSISEMCCCGDGLDEVSGKRKCRIMGRNVLGYNLTTQQRGRGTSAHAIHLRLRHVSAHKTRLHLYEDVAGTLAHELAHCVHAPHNDAFHKLMDEIFDEHAQIMASQLTMNGSSLSMPAFGGTGHVLGKNNDAQQTANDNAHSSTIPNPQQLRAARLQALGGGTTLGGDDVIQRVSSPREAALAAALLRQKQQQVRLRGGRACQPCTIIIDDDDEDNDPKDNTRSKNDSNVGKTQSTKKAPEIIVLDGEEEQNGTENRNPQTTQSMIPTKKRRKGPPPKGEKESTIVHKPSVVIDLTEDDHQDAMVRPTSGNKSLVTEWGCQTCTFRNQAKDESCVMCLNPR